MNLGEVRALLIAESGRRDLVNDDGSNFGGAVATSGANSVINETQRFLDGKVSHLRTPLWYFQELTASDFKIELLDCTTILNVFVNDSRGLHELTLLENNEILTDFNTRPISSINTGRPNNYQDFPIGLAPVTSNLYTNQTAFDAAISYEGSRIKFGDHHKYKGLIIMPPSDGVYTLAVKGRFKAKTLALDADLSYWTSAEPYTLVDGCRAILEKKRRNFSGFQEWEAQVETWLLSIENENLDSQLENDNGIMNG